MSTKDANDVKPTSSKSNEISLSGTATPKDEFSASQGGSKRHDQEGYSE